LFKHANIAFNMPETILVETTKKIKLAIDFGRISEKQMARIKGANGGKDSVMVDTASLTETVKAKLTSDKFKITPNDGSEIQPIRNGSTTTWSWDVTAVVSGKGTLTLNVSSLYTLHGDAKEQTILSFDTTIQVVAPPVAEPKISIGAKIGDFLAKEWKWIWSAILVPVAGYIWSRRKQKAKIPDAG